MPFSEPIEAWKSIKKSEFASEIPYPRGSRVRVFKVEVPSGIPDGAEGVVLAARSDASDRVVELENGVRCVVAQNYLQMIKPPAPRPLPEPHATPPASKAVPCIVPADPMITHQTMPAHMLGIHETLPAILRGGELDGVEIRIRRGQREYVVPAAGDGGYVNAVYRKSKTPGEYGEICFDYIEPEPAA